MVEPELGEVGAEPRVRPGDAEVRGAGQTETTADGRALHRCDHRQGRLEQTDGLGVQTSGTTIAAAVATEVGAGAEVLALCGKDDGSGARLGGEVRVEVRDSPDHGEIEEV